MKKYALWVKILTFVLCVVLLLSLAISGLAVVFAGASGMYRYDSYDKWLIDQYSDIAENISYQVMSAYGTSISEVPLWLLEQTGYYYPIENVNNWFNLEENEWYYSIKDADGKVVIQSQSENVADPLVFMFGNRSATYLEIVGRQSAAPVVIVPENTTAGNEGMIGAEYDVTAPTTVTMNGSGEVQSFWDPDNGDEVFVAFREKGGYTVNVGISRNSVSYQYYFGLPQILLELLFNARMYMIGVIIISFCLFAAAFVFMMIIAGKNPKTGAAEPKALNRLPLDLYLAAAILGTIGGSFLIYELLDLFIYENSNYNLLFAMLICGCGVAVAALDMGFFTALAAQFKVPDFYWWKNSICGRVLKLVWKYVRIVLGYVGKGFGCVARYIREVFAMLPVIWKWIAAGGILGIILLIICAGSASHWYSVFPLAVWCLLFAAVVVYCGYSYGIIAKGIQRMKAGDLGEKIHTEWLYGSFKAIAEDLNALADVVQLAAEKQMKSERMKTELITNVSHDIKTPLTSVINYVDLLQQPHTEEEGEAYLEVLSRQSLRLKKLVDDLMDMSKASSGNMTVNITTVDAVESVNQALGEFADKLDAAKLTPVFRTPDSQLHMKADGRLTWRVLSNLLSNVVKYALPGTRVYIDLVRLNKSVVLSVKNISREELNISAEELTERFVRGDTSRNTEGSGLGLNIAQSLMHLQRGNMELTVDGDLFKVTLIFPAE